MDLKSRISKDFMTAFKEKDMQKKNFLGLIKGEIQLEEKKGIESNDENVLKIIKKMEKSLVQTNTDESKKELEYIKPYLPELMSEEKIKEIITQYIGEGLDNIGKIMGKFNKEYRGKADNSLVSKISKELL
jgi:uncharacterized protein YqeY